MFDIVRTDAYSYINIAGLPYCNACRQCSTLCQSSSQFVGTQSPIRNYRFLAHVALTALGFIAGWMLLRHRLWHIDLWHYILLVVVCYTSVAWFVDLHANPAEGLQTSYLAERVLESNPATLRKLHPAYVLDLQQGEKRQDYDGHL